MIYKAHNQTAQYLDKTRLNKQLVECFQMHKVLSGVAQGWKNHPCVKMWEYFPDSFSGYCYAIASSCEKRGIENKLSPYFLQFKPIDSCFIAPSWVDTDFIERHRQALLYKTALKAMVYDFSLLSNTPINLVTLNARFIEFVDSIFWRYKICSNYLSTIYKPGVEIYHTKRVASVKMYQSAVADFNHYHALFPNREHKIDYKWGSK